MVIAVHAGDFSEISSCIPRLLDTPHPIDPIIVVTDMACLCAKSATVKVGFTPYTPPAHPALSPPGALWRADYFWTHTYHDYVAGLLSAKSIPRSTDDDGYSLQSNRSQPMC
jgi:hypothetical protein